MQLLEKSKLVQLVKFYKTKYEEDVSLVPVIGTLCNPITKNLVQVYVNHQDPTECTFLVIKIPSREDIENYTKDEDFKVNSFFFQFWCRNPDTVTQEELECATKLYHPRSRICKTEKKLFNLLLSLISAPSYTVQIYINVLKKIPSVNEKDDKEYYFRPMTMEELEANSILKNEYSSYRWPGFRLAVKHHTNYGAFCKETNKLLGWVFLNETGSTSSLYVCPEHRSKGLARKLVYKIVEVCRQHGVVPHGYAEDVSKSYLHSVGFEFYPNFVNVAAYYD